MEILKVQKSTCCFCTLPSPEHLGIQVHGCSESFICFECLIQERWENDYVQAYKTDFDLWWVDTDMRCPICNITTKFEDVYLERMPALKETWRVMEKQFRIKKHEELLAKYTVLRGRVDVMQSTINMDGIRNTRLKNRNKSAQTTNDKLRQQLIESQEKTFLETQKISACTTRYLNIQSKIIKAVNNDLTIYESSKRKLIDVFSGDMETYADYMLNGKRQKTNPCEETIPESPPYSFTFPVTFDTTGNISDLFDENSQIE